MSVCTKAKIIETISADDHLILIMENLWIPQSDIQISTTYGESFRVGDIVEIEVKKWISSPIAKTTINKLPCRTSNKEEL